MNTRQDRIITTRDEPTAVAGIATYKSKAQSDREQDLVLLATGVGDQFDGGIDELGVLLATGVGDQFDGGIDELGGIRQTRLDSSLKCCVEDH